MEYKFYYWGPYLQKVKVEKNVCDRLLKSGQLLRAVNKDKQGFNKHSFNKDLAGQLQEQYQFLNEKWFIKEFDKYIDVYLQGSKTWLGELPYNPKIRFESMWINFQKQNELNPLHIHNECTHSFVLYLQVPQEIKAEHDKTVATIKDGGTISFYYGEKSGDWCADFHRFCPEVGELFMFPSFLKHMVAPFRSKVERISVAGNFILYK